MTLVNYRHLSQISYKWVLYSGINELEFPENVRLETYFLFGNIYKLYLNTSKAMLKWNVY